MTRLTNRRRRLVKEWGSIAILAFAAPLDLLILRGHVANFTGAGLVVLLWTVVILVLLWSSVGDRFIGFLWRLTSGEES